VRIHSLALVLVLAACSTADDRGATAASAASLGPDAIILRVPLQGGAARAYRYPALDSLIWQTRAALPANIRPLGFSIDDGTFALSDAAGVAWRLTLGSGQLERALATPLGETVSLDGSGIFGTSNGAVLRLAYGEATPWQVKTAASLSQLQPLRDGGVLLIGQRGKTTVLTRFRPPATVAVDSAELDGEARLISAAGGDRYYLSDGPRGLVSVRARDLERLGTIALEDSIIATASSPSGDRVFVLGHGDERARVQIINKYADEIVARIDVPADANALRMDPLGRYVLVRHGGDRDSVLIIGVASDAIVGRIASPWRADLPLVFPDGRLATLRGDDVVTLSAGDFRPQSVIAGGAKDLWTVVQWNGFRRRKGDAPLLATAARADTSTRPKVDTTAAGRAARAARDSALAAARAVPSDSGLSVAPRRDTAPPRSPAVDSTRRAGSRGPAADSAARRVARADSIRRVRLRADSVRRGVARTDTQPTRERPARPAAADGAGAAPLGERGSFVVQFAALKAEQVARQLAGTIRANGERARVVITTTNGTALYRVILGPYRSRTDAERAGQAAGRDYWVFEGGTN
jgi:cell division septation protein DedD